MLSNWIYILVADNNSGKTTFQKRLIYHLRGEEKSKLHSNHNRGVMWPKLSTVLPHIFFMGKSLQENSRFKNPANYFSKYFDTDAPVCVLSTHATGCKTDVEGMIYEAHKLVYNVCGVFFHNNFDQEQYRELSALNWDKRLWIDNPITSGDSWKKQIDSEALKFVEFLMARARVN